MAEGLGIHWRQFEVVVASLLKQVEEPQYCQVLPAQPSQTLTRRERKDAQVSSILDLVAQRMDTIATEAPIIVDFGGGSGHVSLPLAEAYPHAVVICVDLKRFSLDILKKQADKKSKESVSPSNPPHKFPETVEATGLQNLFIYHGSIQSFAGLTIPIDLGIALHVCGQGTDTALRACVSCQADIIAIPCCVGKLSTKSMNPYVYQATGLNVDECTEILYPQSSTYTVTQEEWNALAGAADYSDITHIRSAQCATRRACKSLVEWDRILYLREQGYAAFLGRLQPWECTPKNDFIVAWRLGTKRKQVTYESDNEAQADIRVARQQLLGGNSDDSADVKTQTRGDWTTEEEEETRALLEKYFAQYPKGTLCWPKQKKTSGENTSSRRQRKMVHAVAHQMGFLHWGEGEKGSERCVMVKQR